MELNFLVNGNLIPGIHQITIEQFEDKFGYNDHRKKLIAGLKKGLEQLKNCGCQTIYVDGSFVTTKEIPGDFDACWDERNMDLPKLINLYPKIVDFSEERKNQKLEYFGEFFPANANASPLDIYIKFFQTDKDNNPKGIIQINLK